MFDELVNLTKASCAHDIQLDERTSPKSIKIHPEDLLPVVRQLHQHPSLFFDMLSCITGIDNGVEAATFEVVYNLYSIPFNQHIMINVIVPRDNPVIESVTPIWKAADWLEREVFDMYGIQFLNHPDLRRILMPADWEGYPLRKDYQQQTDYRDIKVAY